MDKIKLPKLRKIDTSKPERKKPKILLLSDDLRMPSGIGVMSREFVMGTIDKYDWVQLGAAVKHPDHGKIMDASEDAAKHTGVSDASLKIYAFSGYGSEQVLNEIMQIEKPDAILHFTDPRYWTWLYNIEHEVRQKIPIMYYNIWDDVPYPHWNESYYESCDLLMNISRQTQNIVKNVIRKFPKEDWAVQWVPHGVNQQQFFPITETHPVYPEFDQFRRSFGNGKEYDFIIFWNNRNIRRKQPGDVILSYKTFCDGLPKEKAARTLLLMHTQPVDNNGTDLYAVKNAICPEYNVMFSASRIDVKQLNFLYNIADVTVNIASNEGFGISWCESLHTATPIINNVTGGLQDGCRFENEEGEWIDFDTEFSSNHTGRYEQHGVWARAVFPSNRSLQGSPQTPYIFDDRADFRDVASAIRYWYDMSPEFRAEAGQAGRDWVLGDEAKMSAQSMSNKMAKCIDQCLEKFTPRKRFSLYKVEQKEQIVNTGIVEK
jgi:hypothetical protein